MCKFETLSHCEKGYVVKCTQCTHLQIAFGTTTITLTEKQFYEFEEIIKEHYEIFCLAENYDQKIIHIPTMLQSLNLAYSVNELKTLVDILDKAHFELEISNLLRASIQNKL